MAVASEEVFICEFSIYTVAGRRQGRSCPVGKIFLL